LHVTTNGTLLNDERVRWLNDMWFSLIVSCDGTPVINDAMRPMADGSGSFDKMFYGLSLIKKFPRLASRTTLRGTFTAASLHVLERVQFLNELMREGYAGGVSVEPACVSEGCAEAVGEMKFEPRHMKAVRAEYRRIAVWERDEIKAGRKVEFMHFNKIGRRIIERKQICSECGAGWGYVAVNPDGEIHACHREGIIIGHLEGGIDEVKRAGWYDNRFYNNDKCVRCWARNICGGGCRKDAIEYLGDMNKRGGVECYFRKMWAHYALWLIQELGEEALRKAWNIPAQKNASSSCARPAVSAT
jgi:uncharacterized protein